MNTQFHIKTAGPSDAATVGGMVFEMECELWPESVVALDRDTFIHAAEQLLQQETGVWAFLAISHEGKPVGVLTLNECAAIYAGGKFGEIAEIYIRPAFRSSGIGNRLVAAAVSFGRERKWPFLEVGAPGLPKWQRTVDFYHREGFKDIGPRLELKL